MLIQEHGNKLLLPFIELKLQRILQLISCSKGSSSGVLQIQQNPEVLVFEARKSVWNSYLYFEIITEMQTSCIDPLLYKLIPGDSSDDFI